MRCGAGGCHQRTGPLTILCFDFLSGINFWDFKKDLFVCFRERGRRKERERAGERGRGRRREYQTDYALSVGFDLKTLRS